MKKTALFLVTTMMALASSAYAGNLFSVDPRLNKPILKGLSNFTDPMEHKVTVTREFLAKEHLFYFAVTAVSDNAMDMGILSEVTLCKQTLVGDEVKIVRALATPGGEAGEEIASYKAKVNGDKVEIDLTTNMGIRLEGGAYKADQQLKTQDVDNRADRLAWTQVFELKNPEAPEGQPKVVTLGLRFFCLERSNAGYQARSYPDADRKKSGFFTVNLFSGGAPGQASTPGDFLLRHDIKKPIVYTLHPNVPEKFRGAITKGILGWNEVFKKTHGVEPVKVVQGTDANVVPGDPDLNLVYWFPTNVPKMYLGQAHPIADPRTGEIFGSYTLFSQSEIESAVMTTAVGLHVDGADALPPARNKKAPITAAISMGKGKSIKLVSRRENLADELPADIFAEGSPASVVLEKIVAWTVPHECGHSLGLRHNFKSTTDLANLEEGQYCATVMEYLPPLQAPSSPKGYDYKTIAYGYDGKVPSEYNKPYAYGTDEDKGVDPDSNTYDLGEPLQYLTNHFKHIRRARESLTADGNVGMFLGLLTSAVEPLPKFMGVPSDPRSPKAVEFLAGILADQGQVAVVAGGNNGEPSPKPVAEFVFTKNLFERVAVIQALGAMDERVQADPAMMSKITGALAATLVDAKKTDLFTARVVAVQGLLGLGKPGLVALVGAAKQIVAFGQANPTAPTIKQEAALLGIIKEALTPPAQPGEGQPTALTSALKAATAAVASVK